jgi:hypothetical protein
MTIHYDQLRRHISRARRKLAAGTYPRTEVRALAPYQDRASVISAEAHDVFDGMYSVLSEATRMMRTRDAKKSEAKR